MPIIKLYSVTSQLTASSLNQPITFTIDDLALLAGRECIKDAMLWAVITVSNTPDWDISLEYNGPNAEIALKDTINASGTFVLLPTAAFAMLGAANGLTYMPLGGGGTLQIDLVRTTGDLDTLELYMAWPDN